MGAPTHAVGTHLVIVGELVGLHDVFGRQGGFHHAALTDLFRVLLAAQRGGHGCRQDGGVTGGVGPPQSPIPSPSHGQPTWRDTGTVQVAAQVTQVTVHVVDGGAVPVAEGTPAGAIAVTPGLGGLGDIWMCGREVGVTLGPHPTWAQYLRTPACCCARMSP